MKSFITAHKKKIIIVSILILVVYGIKKATYDNEDFLVHVAEGFDDPSFGYFFILERIYKIAETKRIEDKFAQMILQSENSHLHGQYLRICGVIGKSDSTDFLIKIFNRNYKDRAQWGNKNTWDILLRAIDSMGMIGSAEFIPYLETALNEKVPHHPVVSQFQVARSLYLITGERYRIDSNDDSKNFVHISSEVEDARIAIKTSENKRRNFKTMLIIDNFVRAPKYRNKV